MKAGQGKWASVALAWALCVSVPPVAIAKDKPAAAQPAGIPLAKPITAKERQQGAAAHTGIVEEFGGPYASPAQSAYVERVGRKSATQSGLSADPAAFDVTLLNSPINNAFAIPGGYIYVTRQLVALMNDEAELAAVLGHEVGHVAARHSQKRQTAATRNSILGVLGQVLVGAALGGDSQIGQLLNKGIGTGAQLATLGYSRTQESEADSLGIQYLVRAGYDPMAMSTVLQSLAAQTSLDGRIAGNAQTLPAWASTHPDPELRYRRAAQLAAQSGVTNGVRNRDAFLTAIDGIMYGDDPKAGVIEGSRFLFPTGRLTFTIPAGYSMQNGAKAVLVTGTNAQATFASAPYDGNLDTYVTAVFRGLVTGGTTVPQFVINRTTINGIPVASGRITGTSGQSQVDVTVVAYAPSTTQAYHFLMLTPVGQGLGPMDAMVRSFRTMTPTEAAAVKPRYLRVVKVGKVDTLQSLSARMAFTDFQMDRFLVLNGFTTATKLVVGQKVKVVTY